MGVGQRTLCYSKDSPQTLPEVSTCQDQPGMFQVYLKKPLNQDHTIKFIKTEILNHRKLS